MSLVLPMFTLVVFTLLIVLALGALRYVAVSKKQVRAGYFKTFEGQRPPELLVRLSRNYNNLLEMPILFYAVCIVAMALNITNDTFVGCAWAYVVVRVIHSLYHVFFNVPLYRLMIFSVSAAILLAMWIMILVSALP